MTPSNLPRLRTSLSETLAGEARLIAMSIDRWRWKLPPEFAEAMLSRAARIADLAQIAAIEADTARRAQEQLDGIVAEAATMSAMPEGNITSLAEARRRVVRERSL